MEREYVGAVPVTQEQFAALSIATLEGLVRDLGGVVVVERKRPTRMFVRGEEDTAIREVITKTGE